MEKVVYCFYKIFLKNMCESKTSQNCVHIISSKQTYQPRRARVVSQLFYNNVHITPTDNTAEKFHSH